MMVLSALFLLVKVGGEQGLPLPEMMFWRHLLPAIALFGWLAAKGGLARLKTDRILIHGRRAVLGTANIALVLSSVQLLPLSEATVLNFTTPLFTVFLSALLLGERVGPWRWFAVALGMVGVLIIFGFDTSNLPALGVALGIGGAIGGALVALQVRQLSRTEEPIRVVFWFSTFGAIIMLPGLIFYGSAHTLMQWVLIAGIGLAGLFSQVLMTASLRFGNMSSVMVMDYSQLFWATLLGWLVFAHLPPATTWIGAPLIIAAGLLVAWREHAINRRPQAAQAASVL